MTATDSSEILDVPWLVLPTYNEAENIEAIVAAAGEVLGRPERDQAIDSSRSEPVDMVPYKILIVDDGSPDGTGDIADRLAGERAQVEVLHRTEKSGIGPAYLAGFGYALEQGAAYVMEMDSDFSHDPADLARLLAAVRSGADLALGSRYVPGGGVVDWGLLRRFISEGGSTYARWMLSLHVRDLTGGFKCFKRQVLEAIHFDSVRSQGYAFQVELTYRAVRAGFDVVEVPIVFKDRELGQSKMSWRIAAEAMWLVPRLRFGPQPPARHEQGVVPAESREHSAEPHAELAEPGASGAESRHEPADTRASTPR